MTVANLFLRTVTNTDTTRKHTMLKTHNHHGVYGIKKNCQQKTAKTVHRIKYQPFIIKLLFYSRQQKNYLNQTPLQRFDAF